VSLAPKIGDDDIALDPSRAAVEVANRIRALSPHIGAACLVDDQRFKLWKARPASSGQMPAGTLWVEEGRLLLPCADGAVEILELQPPNRSRMDASAFLRGWRGGLALGTVRRDTP
jgi:methionyl-tRNA formyltransferase